MKSPAYASSALTILAFSPTFQAYVLDVSCENDAKAREVVTDGLLGAFAMADAAVVEINRDPMDPNICALYNMLFQPPSTQPDCTAQGQDPAQKRRLLNNYASVQGFRPPSNDKTNINDVIVYCDFKRLVENKGTGQAWDPDLQDHVEMDDDYDGCKNPLSTSKTMAFTTGGNEPGRPSQIQICKWYLEFGKLAKHKTWFSLNPKSILARVVRLGKLIVGRDTRMDFLGLFDLTMLHELTHAVKSEATTDIGDDCYGWRNCLALATRNGHTNADSVAYFGLGATMITHQDPKQRYRPNVDGSTSQIMASAKRWASTVMRAMPWTA
ncbi:MAG: hypothetical protein M1817_003110 [Caeruleum heppii]|nr:MAG: hypothetical protein M1817_003110 [Caeruleum heppii]